MSPWKQDPMYRSTRRWQMAVASMCAVSVAGMFFIAFTLLGHYHQEAIKQEQGTQKGLAIVKQLTDGNQAVLDQLKTLTTGSADAVQKQRLSGRCSQWFLITELRVLVHRAGGDPIPKTLIPTPNIDGLDCGALLTEEISP